MSGITSRCAQQSNVLQIPQLSCSADVLGDLGNLTDFGRALGSIPGTLGNIADCATASVRAQIAEAIQTFRLTMNTLFSAINTTLPMPLFSGLDIPELELELRMRALWQEYKLYLQQAIVNIISSIPGLNFILDLINIPIPFLEGVKVLDVFTSEGRARIRAAVTDKLQDITNLMGGAWKLLFTGELGLNMPLAALEFIIARIFSIVEKLITSAMWAALSVIHTLTQPIQEIWQALGFPTLPALQSLDFDTFFNNIWQGIQALNVSVTEKMNMLMDAMLNFDMGDFLRSAFGSILDVIPWPFPTRLRELLGIINKDYNLTMSELTLSRVITSVQVLFNRLGLIVLELWLQLIRPFLQAISTILAGVNLLLQFIPFTMCSFLNLVAAPLFAMVGTISNLLPPGITVEQT